MPMITSGLDLLKLISGATRLVLKPTVGKRIIGTSKGVFRGYIDCDFKDYGCNVACGVATPETLVQVYELVKDGTSAQVYGSFGENLDRLCMTQDQIIDFVVDHADWLHTEGYCTFFLFKVGTEFFVARVRVGPAGLYVYVYRLSYDYVWHAGRRRRCVVPQLTPAVPST